MNTSKLFRAFFFMVVMTLMALPNSALAVKPVCGDGICNGSETETSCSEDCDGGDDGGHGGGPGGNVPQIIEIRQDSDFSSTSPLWAPTDELATCVLQKNSGNKLSGKFPRHDLCASLPDQDSPLLQDDIIIIVHSTNQGIVMGVEVHGQDVIGTVGIVHISGVMVPFDVSNNSDGNLVIHVHEDNVPLYKCDTHVLKNNSVCEDEIGNFALHDLVYKPDP